MLGAWKEPEDLKVAFGRPFEEIGREIARGCRDERYEAWDHELLVHNRDELERLRASVREHLFH